jgi:ankyrin repeat protein
VKGEIEILQSLIEAGADVNSKGPKGYTCLHIACAKGSGSSIGVIQYLLKKGAHPSLPNDYLETPLHLSSYQDRYKKKKKKRKKKNKIFHFNF